MEQEILMSKEEALEGLAIYSNLEYDANQYPFRMEEGYIGYGDYIMSEDSIELAADWAGIPKKFLGKCSTDLQIELLNEFFTKKRNNKERAQVITRNRAIEKFVPEDARYVSPELVMSAIEKSVNLLGFTKVHQKIGLVHLYSVTSDEQAVSVGDVCRGGAFIEFSPYGDVSPFVAGYVLRLACTNGMISQDQLVKYQHRGMMEIGDWLESVLPNAANSVFSEVAKYQKMKEIPVNGNSIELIKHHMPSGIPRNIKEAIVEEVARKHPTNLYELMNIFTEFGSHRVDDPMQAYRLMYAGGTISGDYSFCPECHTLLN